LSQRTLQFAAIADDFTGGSDLAGTLFGEGVDTVQLFGAPPAGRARRLRAEAVVLCLKTRSVPAAAAVRITLDALRSLQALRPRQIQFKYCSTFDSTERGNIGPVTSALMRALQAEITVAVPALPVNGRTQFAGHLFVNGVPLAESPMRHHPLNPMTDSNLVRFLQKQTDRRVGLVNLQTVRRGPRALSAELHRLAASGIGIALVDAVQESDLAAIAAAVVDLPLVTGGSGLAPHLARLWRKQGITGAQRPVHARRSKTRPRTLILCGSCSQATLAQLDAFRTAGNGVIPVRSSRAAAPSLLPEIDSALAGRGFAAVASSSAASAIDKEAGAARRFERLFGALALRGVRDLGVRHLIVAGGETAGAVIQSLGIQAARVTGIVAPGVPSLAAVHPASLRLVLKSGNFGGPQFIQQAKEHLESL
jgi:uncharacterized protein YgbK (DUF1537 family)